MLEQVAPALMTLDEFIAEYHKQPFELINDERRNLMPGIPAHGLMVKKLFLLLHTHCTLRQLGEILFELPIVETYTPHWVKGSKTPDIMFFNAEKWQQYTQNTPNWELQPFTIVPDFVIEVVSPNDSYSEIQEKVEEYLAKGVQLVWVVDPQRKRITVYHDNQYQRLTTEDTLTGGNVLPGLEIKLNELFQ
jgi:Uma2 family endonuclease